MIRSIPFLIGIACLCLSACAMTDQTARNGYGSATLEARFKPERTAMPMSYRPCPSNGDPDHICNRQQPWPYGQ